MKFVLEILGLFINILAQKEELMKIERLKKWIIKADTGLFAVLSWRAHTNIKKDLEGLNRVFFKLSLASLLISLIMKLFLLDSIYLVLIIVFYVSCIIGISLTWGLNPFKETKVFFKDLIRLYFIGILGFVFINTRSSESFLTKFFILFDLEENLLFSEILLFLILVLSGFISIFFTVFLWAVVNSLIVTFFILLIYLTIKTSRFLLKVYLVLKENKAYITVTSLFYLIIKIIYETF